MDAIGEHRQNRAAWQHLAQLMLDGAPTVDVRRQLVLALLMDGKLDPVRTDA